MTYVTKSSKELKTNWPITEGIVAKTTTQTGRTMNLVAETGSNIPKRLKRGMD